MLKAVEKAEIFRMSSLIEATRTGGNSAVTCVELGDDLFAVKDYSGRHDGIARMTREFDALVFLSDNKVPGFALPVAQEKSSLRAVYTWLPGVQPTLDLGTVQSMLEMLDRLHQLARRAPAQANRPATDSALAPSDVLRQARDRSRQLSGASHVAVRELLCADVAAAQELLATRSAEFGVPVMTLSLSDFGPHNMLWDAIAKAMHYVDLEFFGRDDATKLVCDTLLHPQATWTADTADTFTEGCMHIFGLPTERIHAYLPYYSLKWALIILARAERELDAQSTSLVTSDSGNQALELARSYAQRAIAMQSSNADPAQMILGLK